jgi:hypothetical protein
MGFFSGGKSEQRTDAFSGLRGNDMSGYNALLARTPGDVNFLTNSLQDRTRNTNPFNLNSQGFMASQMEGVNQLGKNMFADVSSNYAMRGLSNPQNVSGVVGSALTQASPALMGMIQQNEVANQNEVSNRFAALNQAMQLYPGLLGQESHSVQKTTSPQLGYTLGSSFFNTLGSKAAESLFNAGSAGAGGAGAGGASAAGGGAALFCWIAEAVYGPQALETHLARWYVNNVLPLSVAGRAFRAWYAKHGKHVADMVTKSPSLKAKVKPVFDNMVHKATVLLRGF